MANRVYRNLDEIFAGEYEGMTYAEIEKVWTHYQLHITPESELLECIICLHVDVMPAISRFKYEDVDMIQL